MVLAGSVDAQNSTSCSWDGNLTVGCWIPGGNLLIEDWTYGERFASVSIDCTDARATPSRPGGGAPTEPSSVSVHGRRGQDSRIRLGGAEHEASQAPAEPARVI